MNKDNNNATKAPMKISGELESWQGLTLEQLRMRRAIALVHRELGRAEFANNISQAKGQVASNGIRGLLFKKDTITKLKTADYLLLGWRFASALIKYRNRRK